jgi:hypothetical protein
MFKKLSAGQLFLNSGFRKKRKGEACPSHLGRFYSGSVRPAVYEQDNSREIKFI